MMTTLMIHQCFNMFSTGVPKPQSGIDKGLLLITSLHVLDIHQEVSAKQFRIY